jgi:hypothetical protein
MLTTIEFVDGCRHARLRRWRTFALVKAVRRRHGGVTEMIMGDGERRSGFIDLSGYLTGGDPAPAAFGGESLSLSYVRPAPAPVGPGLCRRPLPGELRGHLVVRVSAVADATELVDPHVVTDDEDDEGGPPWAVGDVADVYPVRALSRACGRCWACRLPRAARAFERVRRVVAAVRRRSVTVAVVVLMVAPVVVFLWGRWVL